MDPVLLAAFRRGDREALERVYSLHVRDVEDRVRGVLVRMGRLAPADLADLVQDAFLQAFSDRARGQYDGLREYGPFLLTIARNVVVDWIRRSARETPTPDILRWFEEAQAADDDLAPFDSSLVDTTAAYIARLSSDLRALHHFRFVLALPQRQAATAMGISRQSLRTLEKKLLREFRRHLRQSEIKPPVMTPAPVPAGDAQDREERTTALAQRR